MDVAKAKAFLMKKEGGASVYEHLTELLLKLCTEQPDNALATLEQLSAGLKGRSFPDFGAGGSTSGAAARAELDAGRAALLAAHVALFKAPEGEDVGPGEAVQDLTEDAALLEWGGVGLGRTEMFRLHLALKALAAANPGTRGLRWWGKVHGRTADYLVAEGEAEATGEEGDDDCDALGNAVQRTGEGPNKFTYWVCTGGAGSPWTRLPRVTPHEVSAARALRKVCSGSLAAPVAGHPPFPGIEANYLRALIALVSAGTALAPLGAFTAVDGDAAGAIEPTPPEDYAPPSDLASPDAWAHTALELNALGRTGPNPPKQDADGNDILDDAAPEPSVPLKPASDDPPVDEGADEGGGAWDARTCGTSGLPEGEAPTGPAVLRSLRWPGAVTVGLGKRYACVYIGWGLPVAVAPYQPQLPGPVPSEYLFAAEETAVKEQPDVTVAPPEPEAEEGEEGAEE